MANREVMAKLFEATTDDDSKVPEATAKAIVKAACKSKNEEALRDMAQWLADRLEKSESCTVKIKVLRVLMQIMSQPKATAFTRIFAELGRDAVEQTVSFSCEPDPVHGEKPAEYVRSTATKCLKLLPAKSDGDADRDGGGSAAGETSATTDAEPDSDADANGDTGGIKKARAKAKEARLRMESAAAVALEKAEAAAQTAKAAAIESVDAVIEQQGQEPEPEPPSQVGNGAAGSLAPARARAAAPSPKPAPEPAVDVVQPREEVLKIPLGSSSAYKTKPFAHAFADADDLWPILTCARALCVCRRSVEVTVDSRSKVIYEVEVSPDDFEVQWEFTVDSHDVIFGASFARESC
jgi:hypothetical protein